MNLNNTQKVVLPHLIFFLFLCSCSNSFLKTIIPSPLGTSTPIATPTQSSLVISTVSISNPKSASSSSDGTSGSNSSATSSSSQTATLFFNTQKSTAPISNYCGVGSASTSGSKSCLCQFSWNEINSNSGINAPIARLVQTPVTSVQASAVVCSVPSVYDSEISQGTQIKITLIPSATNSNSFSILPYLYTKTSTATGNSFQDIQGQLFNNIYHYACYQKFSRGMAIQSKLFQQQLSDAIEPKTVILASQFCVAKADGTLSDTTSCPYLPQSEYSSQAYYFNLYIRDSERGDINQSNSGFVCPTVTEALQTNGTQATQNQFWPMDTTFALSLSATGTFNVGVEAHTKLSTSDVTSSGSSCLNSSSSAQSSTGNTSSITNSCLGFAISPNTDGTCPNFRDSSGLFRSTYRLRRYVALYPKVFDSNGQPLSSQPQAVDTIYVLDRPVQSSSNTNPLKPYTMYGPKPCPFAFYDRKGVAYDPTENVFQSGYVSTSNSNWDGKNVDGIEFPNVDGTANDGSPSCSAALPLLTADRTLIGITTINKYNQSKLVSPFPSTHFIKHVYIRPFKHFTPHYEEDTYFKACAPQASPLIDPPLHFAREPNSGNVAWCAESYPTQNTNISSIDVPIPASTSIPIIGTGFISPYTSHTVRNSSSPPCNATPISNFTTTNYSYPSSNTLNSGYAYHSSITRWDTRSSDSSSHNASQTCDRTVSSTRLSWTRFPLLSPAIDIENAIINDSSYYCNVSYDNGSGKTDVSTPSDGCCDKTVVSIASGIKATGSAHLEPDAACKTPNY